MDSAELLKPIDSANTVEIGLRLLFSGLEGFMEVASGMLPAQKVNDPLFFGSLSEVARSIPVKRLYPIATPIAEYEYVTVRRILAELVLDQRIQRVEAFPHVGDPAGQPNARRAAVAQHGSPSSRANARAERSSASSGNSNVVPPGKRSVAISTTCPLTATSINPSPWPTGSPDA